MIDINSDLQFFEESTTTSKATGFIVNKELGLIATNKHVTRISPTTHKISFLNGQVEKGTVVYYDFFHDFGFIQLNIAKERIKYKESEIYKTLTEVEFGSSYDLKKNDEIMLIGNNEGVNFSIKYGIVNNINIADFNGLGSIILSDFDRTGGSSGSPVWNTKGKVVAIHAMGNNEGSFEVPIDYLSAVLDKFISKNNINEEKEKNNINETIYEKHEHFDYDKGFIGAFYNLVPLFKIKGFNFKSRNKKFSNEKNNTNYLDDQKKTKNDNEEENFFNEIKNFQRDIDEVPEVIQINSIIPSLSNENKIKSGDIIIKINNRNIGNDLVLLEKILNENVLKKISMKILRFGKIIEINNVKVFSTQKEKINKFLKISNTIIHDVNLYVKLFNPLIPEGIIISKIALGSPFKEIFNDGQFLLSSFNSKKISSINEFIKEFENKDNNESDNIDIMDLSDNLFKFYNYVIDFGNIQEIYLFEFDSVTGNWIKKIIKIRQKKEMAKRVENDIKRNKIIRYNNNHFKYSQVNSLRKEFNRLLLNY